MQTISADAFKAKYGQAGVDSFAQPAQPVQPQGYVKNVTNAVGSDIANRVQTVGQIQSDPNRSSLEKAGQTFGQGVGMAANALEQTVLQAPGIKQAAQGVGAGINWLATSEMSPIKHLGDVIGSSKTLQAVTHLYDTNPRFKDTVDAVANTARLGRDVFMAVNSANFAANVTNNVIKTVKATAPGVVDSITAPIKAKVAGAVADTPATIMNRVARVKPTEYTAFEKMAGKSPGDYLTQTGNFGAPDKIIATEATKFANSYKAVDDALAQLPGEYQNGAVTDALKQLAEKAKSVSTENVTSPYAGQVQSLLTKNETTGLNMSEINTVKRLFEKHVKLGYRGVGAQIYPNAVEQATNVDSAIRTWQVAKAQGLGFSNIAEMNKQTQISKFIVDKLGAQVVGQSGLNGINLTDWVVLSGGNPTSVGAFITKKFLSSKGVQAKIAEMLNQKEIQAPIQPKMSTPTTPRTQGKVVGKASPKPKMSTPKAQGVKKK